LPGADFGCADSVTRQIRWQSLALDNAAFPLFQENLATTNEPAPRMS
jgi:hypothetical protein